MQLRLTFLEPQATDPQALIILGEVRFISWYPRCPFLGNADGAPRHFWESRARLGYGPVPRPTLKKLCAVLACFVGCVTNTIGSKATQATLYNLFSVICNFYSFL